MKLEDMGYPVSGPTAVLTDNSAAYGIIIRPGQSARTSHFERATMLAKRLYQLFVITLSAIRDHALPRRDRAHGR